MLSTLGGLHWTGDIPEAIRLGHVTYEYKEGVSSTLQSDLGGLKSYLIKCEELSCGKVSRNYLRLQKSNLGLIGRSYEEDFGLA